MYVDDQRPIVFLKKVSPGIVVQFPDDSEYYLTTNEVRRDAVCVVNLATGDLCYIEEADKAVLIVNARLIVWEYPES